MDLQTIEMPQAEARKAFLEYRQAVRGRHTEEDEAIMHGYRWLAQGKQLISLPDVMREAGLNAQGWPNLAICRADAEWCVVRMGIWGDATFYCEYERPDAHSRLYVRMPDRTYPIVDRRQSRARSMVPIIPPSLRPNASLELYHVLWEAEWEPVAPRDPALLRHLGGDLWAVLATWDLTDLERTVLSGRRTNLPR